MGGLSGVGKLRRGRKRSTAKWGMANWEASIASQLAIPRFGTIVSPEQIRLHQQPDLFKRVFRCIPAGLPGRLLGNQASTSSGLGTLLIVCRMRETIW
jgi:hypothetical protein